MEAVNEPKSDEKMAGAVNGDATKKGTKRRREEESEESGDEDETDGLPSSVNIRSFLKQREAEIKIMDELLSE